MPTTALALRELFGPIAASATGCRGTGRSVAAADGAMAVNRGRAGAFWIDRAAAAGRARIDGGTPHSGSACAATSIERRVSSTRPELDERRRVEQNI